MNSSNLFAKSDPRLQKLMRQYSDYYKQKNLNIDTFGLTQSSHPQIYKFGQTSDVFQNGDTRRGSDARSLIEQLIQNKKIESTELTKPKINIDLAKPVLVNAQQRIFQEIVNLMMEINEIKVSIQNEKNQTIRMEGQRDKILNRGGKQKKTNQNFDMESIINKLKPKQGEQLKISAAQLQKINIQNHNLQKNINRLKLKNRGDLHRVLEQQKQKNNRLKKKLQQKNREDTQSFQKYPISTFLDAPVSTFLDAPVSTFLDEVTKIQNDISRLELALEEGCNFGNQINKLRDQNDRLKSKAIELIKATKQTDENYEQVQERRRLEEYIFEEQKNKELFLQDLRKFKQEHQNIKNQNQRLKIKLKGNRSGSNFYQNSQQNSYQSQKKFKQYQDLMGEMAEMLR